MKQKICKDCGKHMPYVRQRVRCKTCYRKRDNEQRKIRHSRQLGGIPMTVINHKIVYTKKCSVLPYSKKHTEQREREKALLDESDGQWVREQLYNFRFDIVEFETDQQRKERKLSEYKEWIEGTIDQSL